MPEFYDEDQTPPEYYVALQRRINDGSIWHFEGSAGRAAVDAIKAGLCVLGRTGCRDYWGNYVPSRTEVKPGTHGSNAYTREHCPFGAAFANRIIRLK